MFKKEDAAVTRLRDSRRRSRCRAVPPCRSRQTRAPSRPGSRDTPCANRAKTFRRCHAGAPPPLGSAIAWLEAPDLLLIVDSLFPSLLRSEERRVGEGVCAT